MITEPTGKNIFSPKILDLFCLIGKIGVKLVAFGVKLVAFHFPKRRLILPYPFILFLSWLEFLYGQYRFYF